MKEPPERLKPFIQCCWFIRTEQKLEKTIINKIISDGGSGITYNFGAPFFIESGGRECFVRDRVFFTGVTDKTAYLRLKGDVDAVGIRFYPGVHSMLFGEGRECCENIFRLEQRDLCGTASLYEEMKTADTETRAQMVWGKMDELFDGHAGASWAMEAVEQIRKEYGSARIDSLSGELYLSRRQFERKFKQNVGLTPKQFSRIVRIQKARSLMRSQDVESLTTVGYECDYYDQAHFIREFKDVVKLTPKQYLRSKRMSLLYNSK